MLVLLLILACRDGSRPVSPALPPSGQSQEAADVDAIPPGADLPTLLQLGERYYSAGRYEDARGAFERALAVDPENAEASIGAARTYSALGRWDTAASIWRTLMQRHGSDPTFRWNFAFSSRVAGDLDSAKTTYEQIVSENPNQWRALAELALIAELRDLTPERDLLHTQIHSLREAGAIDVAEASSGFMRDDFQVAAYHVMVKEFFGPWDKAHPIFEFALWDGKTSEHRGVIVLAPDPFSTKVMREVGDIGPETELYFLDWYSGATRQSYGHFEQMPDYDTVKARVTAILSDEAAPRGTVSPAAER